MPSRPLLISWLVLAVACGTDTGFGEDYVELPGGLRGAVHPNEDDRLSSLTDVPVVHVSVSGGPTDLPPNLVPLAHFDGTAAVGLEAPGDVGSGSGFGELLDAVVGPDGEVVLLDGSRSVIRILGPSLEPLQLVGGEGEGPGGLSGARRLFWLGPDELAAFGRERIDVFGRTEGGFRAAGRIPIPWVDLQRDACALDGALQVLGVRLAGEHTAGMEDPSRGAEPDTGGLQPELIHEMDATGEVGRSYSVPYTGVVPSPSHQRRLASVIAAGVLECAPGHVWAGYSVLGEVHAFDEAGRLSWIARLDDFDRPAYLFEWERSGRPAGMDFETGAFDSGYYDETVDRVSLLSERVVAVQVTRTERGSDEEGFPETRSYRTYLLDPEDGHFLGGFTADHQILGGGKGTAVLYRDLPFPRIVVARLEG